MAADLRLCYSHGWRPAGACPTPARCALARCLTAAGWALIGAALRISGRGRGKAAAGGS